LSRRTPGSKRAKKLKSAIKIKLSALSFPVDFGVFIRPERERFEELLSEVRAVEALGYRSVWISDHLLGLYGDPGSSRFECWTTTSTLALATSRIRLGQLVLCGPFRHPPLLAKEAATLDAISGGRLELGIGAGWHRPEFTAYGYPFEGPAARIGRLEEAVQIMKMMWTEPRPNFEGRYYRIEEAYCSPKPAQKPHPPLMIGGGGERLLLRVVARHADVCNFAAWVGTPEDYRRKREALDGHCEAVGRSPEEIRGSWAAFVVIKEDAKEAEEGAKRFAESMSSVSQGPPDAYMPAIYGSPGECIEQVQSYVDVGVSLFILSFLGGDFKSEATLFAEEVTPAFK